MPFDPPTDAKTGDEYTFAGRLYIAREDPPLRTPQDFNTKAEALAVFNAALYREMNGDLSAHSDAQVLDHFTTYGYSECKFYNSELAQWETFPCYCHSTRCKYFWPDARADDGPVDALLLTLASFNPDAYTEFPPGDAHQLAGKTIDTWYSENTAAAQDWMTTYSNVNFYCNSEGVSWENIWDTVSPLGYWGNTGPEINNLDDFKIAHFITHGYHMGSIYKYATVWDNTGYRRATTTGMAGGDFDGVYDVDPEGFQLDIQILTMDEGYNSSRYADDEGYFNGQIKCRIKYNSLLEDEDGNFRFGVSRDGGLKWTMFSPNAEGVDVENGYQELKWDSLEAGVYQLYIIDLNRREIINIRPELKLCNGNGALVGHETPLYNTAAVTDQWPGAAGHAAAVEALYGGGRKCSSKSSAAGHQIELDQTLLPAYVLPPVLSTTPAVNGHHPWHNYLITRINVATSNADTVGSGLAANQTFPDFRLQNCGMALALSNGSNPSVKVGDVCALSLYRDPEETGSTGNDGYTKFWAGLTEKPASSSVPVTPTNGQISDANSCHYYPYHLNLIRGWCTELWNALTDFERNEIIWHGWYWQMYFAGNLHPNTSEGTGEVFNYLTWNTSDGLGQNPPIVYDYLAFSTGDGTIPIQPDGVAYGTNGYGRLLHQAHKRRGDELDPNYAGWAHQGAANAYGGNAGQLWFMLCDRPFQTTTSATAGNLASNHIAEGTGTLGTTDSCRRWGPRVDTTLPALPGEGWDSSAAGLYPNADWIHGATPQTTYEEAPALYDGVGAKFFSFSNPFSEEAEHGVDAGGGEPSSYPGADDSLAPSTRGCKGAAQDVNSWYSTSEGKSEIHLNPLGKCGQTRAANTGSETTHSGFFLDPPTNAEWGDMCDGHSGKRITTGLGYYDGRVSRYKGLLPGHPVGAKMWGAETFEGKEPIGNPGVSFNANTQLASNNLAHPDSDPLFDKYLTPLNLAYWGESAPSNNSYGGDAAYAGGGRPTDASFETNRMIGHVFQPWPKYSNRNAEWKNNQAPDYLKKYGTAGAIAGKTQNQSTGVWSDTAVANTVEGGIGYWNMPYYWNNSKANVSHGGFTGNLITHPGTWPGPHATLISEYHFGKPFFYFKPDVPGLYKFRFEQDTAPQAAWGGAKLGEGCSSEYNLVVVA